MNSVAGNPVRVPASMHSIRPEQICQRADGIIRRLQQAGFEAYLVGGCVRDLLLGLTPKDFDIATSAHPEQVRKLFSSARLIGRRFRLAHIYFGRDYLEVATFRAPHDDSEQGHTNDQGRILQDNVYGTLEEDVWRRDFTINALFYDPVSGDVIDFVHGMQDLKQRELKLIGDPELRYREDPVRMLRALRFAAKLQCETEGETFALIRKLGSLLAGVAPARLFDELLKLLHNGTGWKSFQLLEEYGLLPHLLPVVSESLQQERSSTMFRNLLQASLENTDKRIEEGKSVQPSFLFAVLLWEKVQRLTLLELDDYPELQAIQFAANEALQDQVNATAIPRRFSNITREIWGLQPRFRAHDARRVNVLLNHPRFRAAYDFLCLRAQAGENVADQVDWWTTFIAASQEDRLAMCKPSGKKRRPKKRRSAKAPAAPIAIMVD